MELLSDLQRDLGLTYLFISHDLALVRTFCHSIAVMYLGRLVETGPSKVVLDAPGHPYTRSLLAAVPIPDPEIERRRPRPRIEGEIGSLAAPPPGCRFEPRCPRAEAVCEQFEPALEQTGDGVLVRCHFWRDVKRLPSEFGASGDTRPDGEES
jgi:peptide/nickel transport system ATP-binding protein/oligopeptide transport system ATP-binding protein